jgi:hypothetical protein
MAWKFVVEEFVLQLHDLGPKEWVVEGSIQACDVINAGIEAISLEIVPIVNMDTRDRQAQDVVEEEDIILKIGTAAIVLMTEDLTIDVIETMIWKLSSTSKK